MFTFQSFRLNKREPICIELVNIIFSTSNDDIAILISLQKSSMRNECIWKSCVPIQCKNQMFIWNSII